MNRNSGGVACYIKSDIGYLQKHFFVNEIGKFFVEILFPRAKPLIVGIIYRPPNQSNFLEIINANFDTLDTHTKQSYILGDFNINTNQNNKYIVRDDNTTSSKLISSNIKNYHQFCTMHGLKQVIKSPTHVTCSTSTLTDHILASFLSRVSQNGVINIVISNQLIFCTQKMSHLKKDGIHKYLNFHSFKNYTFDSDRGSQRGSSFFKEKLSETISKSKELWEYS